MRINQRLDEKKEKEVEIKKNSSDEKDKVKNIKIKWKEIMGKEIV